MIADSEHHADLFWAVRGAGPNFCGIVSGLHVQLFPRPPAIFKSVYEFSVDALESVIAWLAPLHETLDNRIELSLTLATLADGANRLNRCVVSMVIFADSVEAAVRIGESFSRSVPSAGLVHRNEMMPRTFGTLLDEARGDPADRHAVETVWTDDPYAVAQCAAEAVLAAPSSQSVIDIGLRCRADPQSDAACSMFARGFVFIDAIWTSSADDAANLQWVDDLLATLHPLEQGAYVNETDCIRHPARLERCYTPEALQRLREINRRYDPLNIFIKPLDRIAG